MRVPQHVRSVVSVEGNFTLKDAFWTSSVARMEPDEVDRLLSERPEAFVGAIREALALT